MARSPAIIALLLTVTACTAAVPRPSVPVREDPPSGAGLPRAPQDFRLVAPAEIAALDGPMRAFVARQIGGTRHSSQRLRRLLQGMQDEGFFDLDYASDSTSTPRETFHQKRGNCLSFTMLFVALAREAGLDVRYQMVDVPPTWIGGSDFVMLSNHINVTIKVPGQGNYVVDFNAVEFKGDYPARQVSDDYALALFYSNLGVEAMAAGSDDTSFEYLSAAIAAYPDIAGPWVNLGVLYSRHDLHDRAEAAYLQALLRDPSHHSALANIAGLYRLLGNATLAAEYDERTRRYQRNNPYYHYGLAEAAYRRKQPQEALSWVDDAIRLKKNEHQFYLLQSLVHTELGNIDAALDSLARAKFYAPGELRERYDGKIAALAGRR